jgi:hypothetical protein
MAGLVDRLIEMYRDPEGRAVLLRWFLRLSLVFTLFGYLVIFYFLLR